MANQTETTVEIRALKEFSSTTYGNLVQGRKYHVKPWLAEEWVRNGRAEYTDPALQNKLKPPVKVETKPKPVTAVTTKRVAAVQPPAKPQGQPAKAQTAIAKEGAHGKRGHAGRGKKTS